MGFFNFFNKDSKSQSNEQERQGRSFDIPTSNTFAEKKVPVSVFVPTSFDDIEKIIDCLKSQKTAIVHLTNLKAETQIRVLDMLSGAIYALDGGVYEMEKNVFMFSPSGVEIY